MFKLLQLGKSLLNIASLFTGGSDTISSPTIKPRDTPIIPRRPPRRRTIDRARHKSLTCGTDLMEETIAEVDSPLASPKTGRDTVPAGHSHDKPAVPMPGAPRVPSPTSTGYCSV